MLMVKQGPKVTPQWMYDIPQTEPTHFYLNHLSAITLVCVFIAQPNITWHHAFFCVVLWHTHHPCRPLLPPTASSNVETMATASWNQFVTHSLHFVLSVRQSSGAAVGENGAQASGASNFSKWGQVADNHTATSCTTPVRPLASAALVRNPKLL